LNRLRRGASPLYLAFGGVAQWQCPCEGPVATGPHPSLLLASRGRRGIRAPEGWSRKPLGLHRFGPVVPKASPNRAREAIICNHMRPGQIGRGR
jgi:hypothetical protein